ncbi:methyltransferase domain-containing protein [Methylovirgula sp. 4M-Z18]|uniref:methyltransferase domain-containing protein n=1 Tax=Methylovirgula sp. 4M-Z18 TaxID=2293567 RepID=UPI000E2F7A20|nr:methyltransferase domain-containing protein [Methylovirgula sp. 4M-Z18]RFB79822.1 methyltransferase domain-containing protein [Methylovirgula sp. 4M-Z18]
MPDIVNFYRQPKPAPRYVGQFVPEFQQALAHRYAGVPAADCSFTHTIQLNDGVQIHGERDLRGMEEAWLGHYPLQGKRVLELAPGSGWISAYAASRACELVCLDAPIGPDDTLERVRRSWWFVRKALGHEAQAIYANLDDPPNDLGTFDVALLGDALSRLESPYRALQRIAQCVTDAIIVVVECEPGDPLPGEAGHPAVVTFAPRPGSGGSRLWHHSPAALARMLATCGFTDQVWDTFTPPDLPPHATLVARKPQTRQSAGATIDAATQVQPLSSAPAEAADLGAAETLPVPPPRLRHLVAGTEDLDVFLRLGRAGFLDIRATLARAGVSDVSIGRLLDFGCGVGRVLRYWITCPGIEVYGTDLNGDAIAWDRENLPFAHVAINGLEPRLPYPDAHFGFVYALSVFTHLPEAMQRPWLAELTRIVRPGGHIYFTTHGVGYRHTLSPAQQSLFDRGAFISGGDDPGSNFYGAFHPFAYVSLSMLMPCGLTPVEFRPEGSAGTPVQDSWLVRKT